MVLTALLLTACTGSPAPEATPPASATASSGPSAAGSAGATFTRPADIPQIVGENYHPLWQGMDSSTRGTVLDEVQASGAPWIRLDIGWHNIQPAGPDRYDLDGGVAVVDRAIREANERGLKILLLFYWAPEWASGTSDKNGRPRDPAQFARAPAWVADRYSGERDPDLRISAIELWNEPDLDRFWAPEPSATKVSDFATLVRVAGAAVKKAAPDITVVTGGLSALDTDWLAAFYAADPGVGVSYDVLGLHAYPSPGDAPPTHVAPDHPEHSMPTITAMGQAMTAHSDPAPIWITEFGWSTHDNSALTPNWARGVTEAQQAQYLLEAMPVLTSEPRVQAAFWYSIWNPPLGDPHMDGFGLLDEDLRRKPSFAAMRCVTTGDCSVTP